ncbi:MAG: hypothetical protein ACOX9B_15485 [Candidatus Xenobium sp.]
MPPGLGSRLQRRGLRPHRREHSDHVLAADTDALAVGRLHADLRQEGARKILP